MEINRREKRLLAMSAQVVAKRLLIVQVLQAKNLLIIDKKKNLSDVYISSSLVDLNNREVRSETFVSQPKKGGKDHFFNEKFSYGMFYIFYC